jgi:hypothetical protein
MTELFYTIADPDCAAARKAVLEMGLKDEVDFRNLFYDEAQRDFAARGGRIVPALWDGSTLHQGLDAVRRALDTLKGGSGSA